MKHWRRAMVLLTVAALLLGCLGLAEDVPQEAPAQVEEAFEAAVEEPIEAPVEDAVAEPDEGADEAPAEAPEDAPVEEPAEQAESVDAAAEEPVDADEWPLMLEQLDAGEPADDEDYEDYEQYDIDENGVLTSYWGDDKNFVVPDGVTAIGEYAFSDCQSLVSVTLPEGVQTIGQEAFLGCLNLKSVKLPASLTSIGFGAFCGCISLESMALPGGVQTIGREAFSDCTKLKSVTLSEGVQTIEDFAFSGCTNLKSVTMPVSLTSIGYEAFCDAGLTALTIPGNGVRIYGGAFENCKALNSVKFTGSVEYLGGEDENDEEAYSTGCVFAGCESLSDIRWPAGVNEIPVSTFRNCKKLENFTIPDTVVKIGNFAFQDSGLRKLIVPGTVKEIGWGAFHRCKALASIELKEGVTSIGSYVFSEVPAKSITLPESLVDLEDEALEDLGPDVILTIPKGSPAEAICEKYLYHYIYSDGESPVWLTYPNRLEMYQGQTLTQKPKSRTKGDTFTYESDNQEAVTVNSKGKITAIGIGEAIITVTGKKSNGRAQCIVSVLPAVDDILLTSNNLSDGYDYGTGEYKRVRSVTLAVGESIEVLPKYKRKYSGEDDEDDYYEDEYSTYGVLANMTYSLSKKGIVNVVRGIEYQDYNSGDDDPEYYEDGCRITAKKAGSTKITFKTCNGKKASIKITVKKAPKKITLPKEIIMAEGQMKILKATLTKGTRSVLEWHPNDEDYIIYEGFSLAPDSWDTVKLYAYEEGEYCVTVQTLNGLSAQCNVIVLPEPTELYAPDELLMGKKEKYTLVPKVDEGSTAEFYFESDDPSIADVNPTTGKITAKNKIGETNITVTTDCGDLEKTIHLSVKNAPANVKVANDSGKNVTKFTKKLASGETYRFTPVLPENSGSQLKVKSSKPKIASVEPDPDEPGSYVVEALKKGTASITIQTFNKKKATITIKVS